MGYLEIAKKWARIVSGEPQKLTIAGGYPTLNEWLRLKAARHQAYNQRKKKAEEEIYWLCREQGILRVERAWFVFTWLERSRRRDPDNVAAGGRKVILDGLVKARRLPGDGWKHVAGWTDKFEAGKEQGVIVEIWRVEA